MILCDEPYALQCTKQQLWDGSDASVCDTRAVIAADAFMV